MAARAGTGRPEESPRPAAVRSAWMPDPLPRPTPGDPAAPVTVPARGVATVNGRPYFPQAGQPHDSCMRCGRATPQGVSLCDADNPAHIGAPSTTQVHGMILAGVIIGFVLIAIGARYLITAKGPFEAIVSQAVAGDAGALSIVLQVTNRGASTAAAQCRVGRQGAQGSPDDLVFLTEPIGPGSTSAFERVLRAPAAPAPPWSIDRLAVTCV